MNTDSEYPAGDPELTEEIPVQFPTRTPRARTGHRPRVLVLVTLIGNLLFGIGVIAVNMAGVLTPPPATPTCEGRTMAPADTCQVTDYLNGMRTSVQYFSYDQMLANQRRGASVSPLALGLGVGWTGLSLWGLSRCARRHRRFA